MSFIKFKKVVFVACLTSLALFLVRGDANEKRGPFPIKRSPVKSMAWTYVRKLEAPTLASALAAKSPDGTITLLDNVVIKTPVLDPVTGLPQVNPDGTAVIEETTYFAGTVLNPSVNPSDDILIPTNISVSNAAMADGHYTVGRFAYLGNAPRFTSDNLEMVASKMGHSLRVKAWVTPETINGYELALLTRFKGFYDAFMKPTMHFETLQSLEQIAQSSKNVDTKKWFTVASYYGKHLLENPNSDIYAPTSTEAEYKETILTAMLRTLMNDQRMSISEGLDLVARYQSDPSFIMSRQSNSARLFAFHLGHRYTSGIDIDPTKPGRVGFLTFVYPIAIDKRGPFRLPSPGLRKFPLSSSIEGRWWSNRWVDEFGGFPFIQITSDGVAFHGPITMSGSKDTWYLRRDNVSHSCMRMDPSDLLELRALMPKNMNQLQKLGQTIPLRITEWPDVTDADNNGTYEVMDVAYYSIPTSGGGINNPLNWRPSVYNKNYWNKFFAPFSNRLPSKNTFKVVSTPTVDPTTGETTVTNTGEFTGLPKYDVVNGVLKIVGYHTEMTPIMTFPQRPTSIIQYREDGIVYKNADDWGGDAMGSYPPAYFNRL